MKKRTWIVAVAAFAWNIQAQQLPNYTVSWVGNSFGGANGKWVQNFIDMLTVQKDGTVWTCSSWDENGRKFGEYKNGDVIGNVDHKIDNHTILDRTGARWTIEGWTNVDRKRNGPSVIKEGTTTRITDCGLASCLAIANNGMLMVGDDGPRQQIRFYDITKDPPVLDHTFGDSGGALAGPIPGLVTPTRFYGIHGCGMDSAGNIYVGGTVGGIGGTWIRSLKPDGTLNWQLYGHPFTRTAYPDASTDGVDVFETNIHYKMDYSKSAGQEQTWYAVTLDKFKYPVDDRITQDVKSTSCPVITVIQGRRFMFACSMGSGQVRVYRFDGEIAIQNGYLPAGAEGWWIDDNGDAWIASGFREIRHYTLKNIDAQGNLVWNTAFSTEPKPAEITELNRILYYPKADVMYLSGYTTTTPRIGTEWGQAGTGIYRYDNWSGKNGTRTLTKGYPVNWPYKVSGGDFIMIHSVSVAGDLLFCTFSDRGSNVARGETSVYRASTGKYLGYLAPKAPIGTFVGQMDIAYGTNAIQRKNGEIDVFVQDDGLNKTMVFRITGEPPQNGNAPANAVAPRSSELRVHFVPSTRTIAVSAADITRSSRLTILDARGRTVYQALLGEVKSGRATIPMPSLRAGRYWCHVETLNGAVYSPFTCTL